MTDGTAQTTRSTKLITAAVILFCVIVVLQLAILLQRQIGPERSLARPAGVAPAARPTLVSRIRDRFFPRPAKPVSPETVWSTSDKIAHMHEQINRMFEQTFRDASSAFPLAPAAASNATTSGGSAPFANDPFTHINHMRRQIDAMFANARGSAPAAGIGFEDGWADLVVTPGLNVTDTGDVYQVTLQLPGFDKSRIRVTLDGSLLDIVAERRQDASSASQSGGTWTSRSASRFERRLRLPQADPRPGAVKATYQDDVLRITVPKTASGEAGAGQIPVI